MTASPARRADAAPRDPASGERSRGALTLADREAVTGRVIRWRDDSSGPWHCADCLQDLPDDYPAQSRHQCGEPPPGAGDLVWYAGCRLPDGFGRLYEVTAAAGVTRFRGGRLRLADIDQVLANVPARNVIVIRARTLRRLRPRSGR